MTQESQMNVEKKRQDIFKEAMNHPRRTLVLSQECQNLPDNHGVMEELGMKEETLQ